VPNLEIMGYALRMRWLWERKAQTARPWMSLHDDVEQPVAMLFHYSTTMQVGDRKSALFWSDRWINGQSVAELAPCLLQTVGKRIQKRRTVFEGLQNRQWVRDISGALIGQVILDYTRSKRTWFFGSGLLTINSQPPLHIRLSSLASVEFRGPRSCTK
jgi:hypothetical protein